MKLSAKEGDILACMEQRADLPIFQVRKESGYRDHTIRYHIHRLEQRGVIRRMPFINVKRLGYTEYNLYFSIASENVKLKGDLLRELDKIKQIIWVAELGGDFQYGVNLCVKSIYEVHKILTELSQKFPNVFFHKIISSQYAVSMLPRGYLSSKKFKPQILSVKPGDKVAEIDELDDRILSALVQYPGASHRRIAQEIRVPLSTLELRIKKLEANGVIQGYYYETDATKFEMEAFKLLLFAKGVSASLTKRLLDFCAAHPNVVHFIECFGAWDYELGLEVRRAEDVVGITQEVYDAFGQEILEIKTLTRFRTLKLRFYPG